MKEFRRDSHSVTGRFNPNPQTLIEVCSSDWQAYPSNVRALRSLHPTLTRRRKKEERLWSVKCAGKE